MNIFFVAVGGALGASLRWLMSCLLLETNKYASFQLPLFTATLVCNIIGCFIIGFASTFLLHSLEQEQYGGTNPLLDPLFSLGVKHEHLKLFLITGLLGGFTTFSSFSLESLDLFEHSSLLASALYITASIASCLVACYAGKICAHQLLS